MADIKIAGRIKAGAADNIAGYASEILFDDEASDKTVKEKLEGKQDTLTFDNVPTKGSNNPVKSGGVYQAIQDIDVSSQISGKADKSEMSVVAGTGANADKTTITLKSGTSATVLTQHQDISGKEDKSNKVTSFSSPTDTQYPSAKLVNDQLATKQGTISDLSTIRSGAAAGATAVQSVTVGTTTTGAAGSSASVTNTGTATEPILSFTIPQGAQGIQGIQGPQGERGPQGNTGVQVDSVASIIHSIDPTATYAAADVAGADAVQDVLSEVTELAGNVALGAIYDVSAKNPTAGSNNDGKFESLSALLSDANLNTLIPTANRKGGMSIKFVQSSDSKYVQYRLMADSWSINTDDWAIAEEGVYVDNPEFVYVKTDSEDKILFGIKVDGEPYFGVGCPEQVKEYVEQKIADLSLDEYEDIVAFLSDYLDSDTTLKVMIDGINASLGNKLDAEGLDPDALATVQAVENPEYIQVTTDSENKILEGIKTDGTKVIETPVEIQGVRQEIIDNPEWIEVKTDSELKVIEGITARVKKIFIPTVIEGVNVTEKFSSLENYINNVKKPLIGKKILCIGDSVTVSQLWGDKVAELTGAEMSFHAKGGIGIVTMVDGDNDGFPPLSAEDVDDKDFVLIMGFYNARDNAIDNPGNETDMYPSSGSFIGRVNYVIDKIYQKLSEADNHKCKVVIITAHKYGKYSWIDRSSYTQVTVNGETTTDGEALYSATKRAADYNSLALIDLMHGCNINKYNWNDFQYSNSPYNQRYIPADGVLDGTNKPFDGWASAPSASENSNKYITVVGESNCFQSNGTQWIAYSAPYIWNSDQLHPNEAGYERIGEYIAGKLIALN